MNNDILVPLLLRTAGRSGSTLMMFILSCSDDIFFDETYPFETRDLSYLFRLAQVCTCASERLTHQDDIFKNNLNFIGRYPYQSTFKYLSDDEKSFLLMLANLWEGYSKEAFKIAPFQFYAEKAVEDIAVRLNDLMMCKNIFLFRDPRAEMLSIIRFNQKRGTCGFDWNYDDSMETFAIKLCNMRRQTMLHLAHIENDNRRIKIFYEDLIANFETNITRLELFLETTICRDKLQTGLSSFKYHMTSIDAIQSVDDWKRELPENIKNIFSTLLEHELKLLGYEP